MKSNSKAASVKSMKAAKKSNYSAAADAIKNKLVEIKQDHHTYKANPASLALFGQNPFQSIPSATVHMKHWQQAQPTRVPHQLSLF
ncbi:MAG: hypothetical protein JST39_04680 [Bacteroidetes bacterium]|nr:hypothetical protein [Bacteroidota bacterium]